jgi:aspartyl-tRNA(Asn)/glutamyl-tRNA(Gln) amidotransferase subunit A
LSLLGFSNIQQYHTALLNGHTTCVEAVRFYLQAIAQKKHLNAFVEVFEAEALEQAGHYDVLLKNKLPLLPLQGVIVGIKDVLAYENHGLTASSNILKGFTSIYTATAVKKLLDAGAIIIGRQNCDEFAMGSSNEHSAYGPVLNAADETRVPGGSSGGSAVAVQAGLCMVSLGSDTGGSVRQPADFCGIVGLKPSYGRISRHGLIAYASSFDSVGIFSNSIPDAALVLQVIAGADDFDSTVSHQPVPTFSQEILQTSTAQPKLAYFKQFIDNESLNPEIKEQFLSFCKNLTEKGYIVEPIDFELLEYIVPTYYVLTTAEASSNLSRYDGVRFGHRTNQPVSSLHQMYSLTRTEGFGKEVQKRIMLGSFVLSAGYYDAYFTKAQQVRTLLVNKTQAIFDQYNAILSPTVPDVAWKFGEKSSNPIAMYLADIYTVFANLTGIPAISLPLFKNSQNLPFGLQVMASRNNELPLLRLSQQLMSL